MTFLTNTFIDLSEVLFNYPLDSMSIFLVAANFGTHFLSTITTGARVTTTSFISEEATNNKEESMLERCLSAKVSVKSKVAEGKAHPTSVIRKTKKFSPDHRNFTPNFAYNDSP